MEGLHSYVLFVMMCFDVTFFFKASRKTELFTQKHVTVGSDTTVGFKPSVSGT